MQMAFVQRQSQNSGPGVCASTILSQADMRKICFDSRINSRPKTSAKWHAISQKMNTFYPWNWMEICQLIDPFILLTLWAERAGVVAMWTSAPNLVHFQNRIKKNTFY